MLENQFSNDIKGVDRDFNFAIYVANIYLVTDTRLTSMLQEYNKRAVHKNI